MSEATPAPAPAPGSPPASPFPLAAELLAKFDRRRMVLNELARKLAGSVPARVAQKAMRHLGVRPRGRDAGPIIPSVLADYCVFCHETQGLTLARRYAREQWNRVGPEKQEALLALVKQEYSLYRVRDGRAAQGLELYDTVRRRNVLLVEPVLGAMARGTVLAGRVLPFEDGALAAAALLPLPESVATSMEEQMGRILGENPDEDMSGPMPVDFEDQLISTFVRLAEQTGVFEPVQRHEHGPWA